MYIVSESQMGMILLCYTFFQMPLNSIYKFYLNKKYLMKINQVLILYIQK